MIPTQVPAGTGPTSGEPMEERIRHLVQAAHPGYGQPVPPPEATAAQLRARTRRHQRPVGRHQPLAAWSRDVMVAAARSGRWWARWLGGWAGLIVAAVLALTALTFEGLAVIGPTGHGPVPGAVEQLLVAVATVVSVGCAGAVPARRRRQGSAGLHDGIDPGRVAEPLDGDR
ncbi:hypothetical protein GCM10022251_81020 [Phytohabitans flavus]|uniref:Uncharacterized protein n=1 Tax=Phytohabitans flavus TaxID=1076124 RepID=A0A6F8XL82_9ACTN|nr:hypothetical protein [Phytohabitans flavus]BCB74558.1 hypothetical protein Pflav_009680 [Phytohabitans flavus]